MKITKNFGNRTHVSFIVNTKHKGVGMYVFVEATEKKQESVIQEPVPDKRK